MKKIELYNSYETFPIIFVGEPTEREVFTREDGIPEVLGAPEALLSAPEVFGAPEVRGTPDVTIGTKVEVAGGQNREEVSLVNAQVHN